MSNYTARFDEVLPEANRVIGDQIVELRKRLPKLYVHHVNRQLRAIRELLESVDKGNIDHPEHMAHTSGNIAELAVTTLTGIPNSLANGVDHFVQTTMPTLNLIEDRLSKAVGNYYYKVRGVKNSQVREIQQLAAESLGFRNEILETKKKLSSEVDELITKSGSIEELSVKANASLQKIEDIQKLAQKLASGDGRGKSLENFRRKAEAKVEQINDILGKANTSKNSAEKSDSRLTEIKERAEKAIEKLESSKAQASDILNLSTQAGLAASYLNESKDLKTRSNMFTGILYGAVLITIAIAAIYVLPGLEKSITAEGTLDATRALSITLLRATILAPLVFVIYFTTKQISSIETLRMDYAEKAAASLAYSGYKDEMTADGDLLERLRGSLIHKFAEHPERLLRKIPTREKIKVRARGFTAESDTGGDGGEIDKPEKAVESPEK